jgi:hypothetical protein
MGGIGQDWLPHISRATDCQILLGTGISRGDYLGPIRFVPIAMLS